MARVFLTSDETREVINGHAKDMAAEYGCDRSYYDQIVSNHETDGFEKFRQSLFLPALRAGRSVTPWLTRLTIDQEKYLAFSPTSGIETETAKFVKEAADIPIAHISQKPAYERLNEICEAETQLAILKAATIAEINQEKDEENSARSRFGNKPVSMNTRNEVRGRMKAV